MDELPNKLSPEQQEIVRLERFKFDVVTKFYEQYEAALKKAAEKHGVGSYFQDAGGIVYKIAKAKGTYVTYKEFGIDRLRFAEEIERKSPASLSMAEAERAGFTVAGKK